MGFVSLKESLDFTTPTGRLMLHLLGAFAEFERELIRERVKAGVAHAKAKGKRLGQPTEEIDVRRLLELRNQGSTVRAIAKGMGVRVGLVHKTLKIATQKPLIIQESILKKSVFIKEMICGHVLGFT